MNFSRLRHLLLGLICLATANCASVSLPTYIPDRNAYRERFYATFEQTHDAVESTLYELGWTVEQSVDPAVYEQWRNTALHDRQILLISVIRQRSLFVGTRYARLNVYIRNKGGISEVEARFIKVTSLPLKNFTGYRDEKAARRFFDRLQERLAP